MSQAQILLSILEFGEPVINGYHNQPGQAVIRPVIRSAATVSRYRKAQAPRFTAEEALPIIGFMHASSTPTLHTPARL